MKRNSRTMWLIISILLFLLLLVLCVYVQNGLRHISLFSQDNSETSKMVIGSSPITKGENDFSSISEEMSNVNDEETEILSSATGSDINSSMNYLLESQPQYIEQSSINADNEEEANVIEDSYASVESKPIEDGESKNEQESTLKPEEESSESLPIINGENKENELPIIPIG